MTVAPSPRKSFVFLSVLAVLICVFTVVAVAHIMELGSSAFFVVVVTGALVLMCFFCALISYARGRLLQRANGTTDGLPVFYYLQTIHRSSSTQRNIDDDSFWVKGFYEEEEVKSVEDSCPICLCDIDSIETATGISQCCRKELHVACAQKYFNAIQQVRCPLCRYPEDSV